MLWKMTLNGLYDYGQLRNDDLFEDMILPDHLDKEVVLNSILIECGELPIMWADYPFLKNRSRVWFKRKKPIFDKMVELLEMEFNPLYNYDRFEEYAESETEKGSATSSGSGNATNTNAATSYESEAFKNTDKQTSQSSNSAQSSSDNKRDFTHSAHLFGNIGITTSVDMLTQAAEWYSTDIPKIIAEEFKCDFCIGLYC